MSALSFRGVYDAIERQVSPRVEATVNSREYTAVTTGVKRLRSVVAIRVECLNARLLHLVNLPAGSDIRKLRRQIGELDYEVRTLRMTLEARLAERKDTNGADS
ncbi:MAG TPA: hypothetical protein VE485_01765 [Mycobacterium sp.]|jgi:hypothetical protein|nr:hypothetical protein [Mycobacterium sp.]